MSSSYPKSIDAIFGTAQTLCRYVAEATDNKFQIEAYAAGELTPSRQALDAVTSGSVDCAFTPLHFYFYKDPVLGVGSGLPFGLNARHQLSWWAFGGGNEIVNAALKKLNVYGIPAGSTGAQMGAWFKKEINTIEDLKGLRIRVGALGHRSSSASAPRRTTFRMPTFIRRWKRHHRCRRVHLSARRRAARHRQAGQVQLPPVLVGKRRDGAPGRQSGAVERPAQALPGHRRARLLLRQFLDARAL